MSKHLIAFLTLIVFLTGCLGFPWAQSGSNTTDNVRLSLWVSHHSVRVGQPLQIRFTARNLGNETAIFETQTESVMDINIGVRPLGGGGFYVRWSDGKPLTRELTRLELKPGESKTIEMTWTPDERSDYSIVWVDGIFWYRDDNRQYVGGLPVTVGFVPIGLFP